MSNSPNMIALPGELQELLDEISMSSGYPPHDVLKYALEFTKAALRHRRRGRTLYYKEPDEKYCTPMTVPWPETFLPVKTSNKKPSTTILHKRRL